MYICTSRSKRFRKQFCNNKQPGSAPTRMKIFAAFVAFVVLVDMVTGQGPPILNSYAVGAPQVPPPIAAGYAPRPAGYQAGPLGYGPRGEYDAIQVSESDYDKAKKQYTDDEQKDLAKTDDESGDYKTTPAPGMMSSLSNAWKSISSFGRQTRSTKPDDNNNKPKTAGQSSSARGFSSGSGSGSSVDDWSAQKNRGYIYVKLPKLAVCYS